MALVECDRIHGKTILHEQDPVSGVAENILYMPVAGEDAPNQRSHGLYDGNGLLLEAAGRFRGPARERAGPLPYTTQRLTGLPLQAGPFFYLGRVVTHYGHFLLDTLCRLWALPPQGAGGIKILYHDGAGIERLFALPFAAVIFRACGLGSESFVKFDEPVRLGRVILPSPAIEEMNFIHSAFARKFNEIGNVLCPGPAGPMNDRPVYLTKQNVGAGVSHFVNEQRFTEVLARAGIEIIAPETLPFARQVALFRENRIISGLIGSAFHTSLFTPACRMLILNYHRTVWSNQLLIDRANGNQAEYVYDPEARQRDGGQGGFMNNFEMADPVRLAEDFLRRLDGFAKAPPRASLTNTARDEMKYTYAICACARWETPYIVEWLDYYRALGFSHVYLYCNDDDPGPFYEEIQAFMQGPAPFVTLRHHPYQGQQYEMYVHFVQNFLAETEWVSFFDIDEFLRLPPGVDVAGFMRRFIPEVECVMFNWVFFGTNGHKTPPPGPVLENYTRRTPELHPYTKYIARSSSVAEIDFTARARAHAFWHDIDAKIDRIVISANALGETMQDYYTGFPALCTALVNEPGRRERLLQTAVIHHYAFRSEQAYADRIARGLKGDFGGQEAWRQAVERPDFAGHTEVLNMVEDRSLAGFWQSARQRGAAFGSGHLAGQVPALPPDALSTGRPAILRTVPEAKYRFVLIACARWETECIAEWIAYHRHIGFEHLYLYCNDDAPEALYEAVLPFLQGADPFVTFHHFQPLGQQKAMYLHYLRHYKAEAEWMMFLDIDEFLRLPRHATIGDFIAEHGAADAIYFNWCYFGNNGFDERPPGSVLLQYNRRAASSFNVMTKMITRSAAISLDRLKLGPATDFWHYWNGLEDFAALRAVNVLGRDMHDYIGDLDASRAYLDEPGVYEAMIATGIVNHYAYKSRQDFLRRAARGTEGVFENQLAFKQMYESGRMEQVLARLNAVEDNVLRDLWAGVLAQGRVGAIASASALPDWAGGAMIWGEAAAPDGPVYFVQDSQEQKIAAVLAAGRKTIVVEPDAKVYYELTERFAEDLAAGRLVVENYLPAEQGDGIVLFAPPGGGAKFHVGTIGWPQLLARHGAPAAMYMSRPVPGFPAPAGLP